MTENTKNKIAKPPVVVVMGHIDHGKTKILDWYRQTKVVESESGGITQHVGAYELEYKGKQITFIDTPGHESFSKMRARGAKVADVAVLVVAGDEGVKPQTQESIRIILENELPYVVALNKSDKPEFNVDKVKQELAKENVLAESYGGQVPMIEISAKTGQNMDALLEMILLVAEVGELHADPAKPAEGVVVEAHLDAKRGITATLLVLDGTIKKGDILAVGRSVENIKMLENFLGKPIDQAGPSSPVKIVGLIAVPTVGEKFQACQDKKSAADFIAKLPPPDLDKILPVPADQAAGEKSITLPAFNIILKADVVGSQEVLEEALRKLAPGEIDINIIHSGVGNINETDVKFALATRLVTILGFKVKIDPSVKELAEKANIRILTGDVIYKLLDETKEHLADLLPPIVTRVDTGRAKILKVFKQDGRKQIVGGKVEDGRLEKGALIEVKRGVNAVGRGKINQLQQNKIDTNEVAKGYEFGTMIESEAVIKEGDFLEVFHEDVTKRKL